MKTLKTDVLVVGAGPVGLTCAALTAMMGMDVLTIDRRDSISYYPKARALTARSLEIFRQLGIDRKVYEVMPAARTRHYAIGTSLDSSELQLIPFGLGSLDPRPDTPCAGSFCTQDRLEPILEARLREELGAELRFGVELLALEQDRDGVTATARDLEAGTELRIRARLAVGADGARSTCAELANIAAASSVDLEPALTVIFKARLSHLIDPLASVYLLLGKPGTGIGGMVSGVSLARHPEEWSMVATHLPDWGTELTAENAGQWREFVRNVTGMTDLNVSISAVAEWSRAAAYADRLVSGRIVLAGDSAHRMPPAGGLGLNTGLQDAHNLSWRLAAIIKGSSLSLLDDYDRERRPEIARAVGAALENHRRGAQIDKIWNKPQVGLSLGVHYEAGSFVAGTPQPERTYPYHEYTPSGRPGGRAPHFWLDEAAGMSVLDLFGKEFVVLTERADAPVCRTADQLRSDGAPIHCHVLDHLPEDVLSAWRAHYEVGADSAVLVRPDGHIAFRSNSWDGQRFEESFLRILHVPGRQCAHSTSANDNFQSDGQAPIGG